MVLKKVHGLRRGLCGRWYDGNVERGYLFCDELVIKALESLSSDMIRNGSNNDG